MNIVYKQVFNCLKIYKTLTWVLDGKKTSSDNRIRLRPRRRGRSFNSKENKTTLKIIEIQMRNVTKASPTQ
jgi:hypothetical protein